MKAIILAAGVGKRLGQFIKDAPKCLMKFGGKSLLRRLMDDLVMYGVTNIVIVVGYKKEKIFAELRDMDEKVNKKYIVNDNYKIGSIVSLWKARGELDDDVIIMDADVLCDKRLIEKLVLSPNESCFLMDKDFVDTGEEQKLGIKDGRVITITKGQHNEPFDLVGEAVGFLKLSKNDSGLLAEELSAAVGKGIDNCEHEEMYDKMLNRCNVGYETTDGLPWIEIDFPEDVKEAEEIVKLGLKG
ncbi:MAG: phosphocholine cytidylyltransferase family protein [Candidatus Anammoxibacter sp.]